MARYARRRSVVRRPRRALEWADYDNVGGEGLELSDSNSAAWGNALGDYEQQLGADIAHCTVTRIRGSIWFVPPATTVQEYNGLNIGFIIDDVIDSTNQSNSQAQSRADSPYKDWMYYRRIQTASAAPVTDFTPLTTGWPTHYDIDIKSQRRFTELNQTLYFVAGLGDSIGTGNSLKLFYSFRILLKQP